MKWVPLEQALGDAFTPDIRAAWGGGVERERRRHDDGLHQASPLRHITTDAAPI